MNQNIDALILCGGSGTRFMGVSENIPKALADIHNRPFVNIIIEFLILNGIKKIILCTGHMSDTIKERFENSLLKTYMPNLIFSKEQKPMGTGGAVKNAEPHILSENFFVINGDSFCEFDLSAMMNFHISKNALISMVLTTPDDRTDTGNVTLDEETGAITGFEEKNAYNQKKYTNAGIYIFNKEILKKIPKDENSSLEYSLFPQHIRYGAYGFKSEGELIDIGTPDRYKKALAFFNPYE
ncbi:MAG: Nucleotidyl transferase [Parcubacteria group bacterium GW2011_GWA2_38_13]|nr:MAG: Nucleotidyl transferase [Parcubacteria group bacterium GW2011_GWA2_38_13]